MEGMQLRHLETYLAIVDGGTLTAAAAQLFKTQAAVSQDLKALESSVGLQLIDRSGQRVTLTTAGEALVPMARRLLGELEDAEAEMARIRAGDYPIIRLACLPSLATRVTALIGQFATGAPALRWSLITALRGAMIDGLRRRHFDVVICEAKADDDIFNSALAREPLRIVLPATHPLAGAAVLKPADLNDVPYIGLARGMGATAEAQRFFASEEAYPAPKVEVNDTRLVLQLVVHFDGFGILPLSALPSAKAERSTLTSVPTDPPLVRQLCVSHLRARVLPPSVQAVAQYLIEHWNAI